MAAYNFESKGLVDAILTPIAVCEAVEMNESIVVPKIFRSSNCMWDTGATNTLISQKVVDDLGLKPYGVCLVSDNTTTEKRETFLVHLGLPTGTTALNVEAMLTLSEDYDVVIGMHIISLCDFCFTNKDNASCFSLRHPSNEKIILK